MSRAICVDPSCAFDRRTRESTPCDLIISADNVKPPASTIKQRTPIANQSTLTAPSNSTTREMEDLLARMEQSNKQDQQRFIERYVLDSWVNDNFVGKFANNLEPPTNVENNIEQTCMFLSYLRKQGFFEYYYKL